MIFYSLKYYIYKLYIKFILIQKPKKYDVLDSIYNLNKPKNIEIRKAETNFEKDILKIVKKMKIWKKTFIKRTKTFDADVIQLIERKEYIEKLNKSLKSTIANTVYN